jgi:hypothetical protein
VCVCVCVCVHLRLARKLVVVHSCNMVLEQLLLFAQN